LASALKTRSRPVENDCGQMCTKFRRGRTSAFVARDDWRAKKVVILARFGAKKRAADTRQHVTSCVVAATSHVSRKTQLSTHACGQGVDSINVAEHPGATTRDANIARSHMPVARSRAMRPMRMTGTNLDRRSTDALMAKLVVYLGELESAMLAHN